MLRDFSRWIKESPRTITGTVVSIRSLARGLTTWDLYPRIISIVRLESGTLAAAWIALDGRRMIRPGTKVELQSFDPGDRYPVFCQSTENAKHSPAR